MSARNTHFSSSEKSNRGPASSSSGAYRRSPGLNPSLPKLSYQVKFSPSVTRISAIPSPVKSKERRLGSFQEIFGTYRKYSNGAQSGLSCSNVLPVNPLSEELK